MFCWGLDNKEEGQGKTEAKIYMQNCTKLWSKFHTYIFKYGTTFFLFHTSYIKLVIPRKLGSWFEELWSEPLNKATKYQGFRPYGLRKDNISLIINPWEGSHLTLRPWFKQLDTEQLQLMLHTKYLRSCWVLRNF